MGVLVVVLADTEDVAGGPGDRRFDLDLRQRHGRKRARHAGAIAFDQRKDAGPGAVDCKIDGCDGLGIEIDNAYATFAGYLKCRDPHPYTP
jgi:hypothetical protein